MPNIRNRVLVAERLWDWDFLNECWAGKIRPSDIDGVVERNGQFLFLEGKPTNGNLGQGQEILFKNLTHEFKSAEVLVLYGEPGYPIAYRRIYNGIVSEKKPCNRERIKTICKAWYSAVDSMVGLNRNN